MLYTNTSTALEIMQNVSLLLFVFIRPEPHAHSLLVFVTIRTPHKLFAHIRTTKPRHEPRRLVMPEPAPRIPTSVDARVMAPVLIIEVLALRLRAIHAIETQTVEVLLGVCLGLQDHTLPVRAAAAFAGEHEVVFERAQTVDDLLYGRVTDDIFDGEGVDLGEGVEVLAYGRVPAGALFSAIAEQVTALLVK
jgi:hypothetical protein